MLLDALITPNSYGNPVTDYRTPSAEISVLNQYRNDSDFIVSEGIRYLYSEQSNARASEALFSVYLGSIKHKNLELHNESFIPKTTLGKKLWEIKKKMIAKGETTNNWDEVVLEISEARGSIYDQKNPYLL